MYVRFCEKNKLNCELVNTDKTRYSYRGKVGLLIF